MRVNKPRMWFAAACAVLGYALAHLARHVLDVEDIAEPPIQRQQKPR